VQFCAYRLRRGHVVLDMQSDVLSHLKTRLVAPLVPEGRHDIAMMVLEPVFELDGTRMILLVSEMVTVPARELTGPPVARFVDEDCVIRRALDMLFSGF
jgi:toxin CcdB